jgi:membrane protein required for colicin V production
MWVSSLQIKGFYNLDKQRTTFNTKKNRIHVWCNVRRESLAWRSSTLCFEKPTIFYTFILLNIHTMNWIDLTIVVILILSLVMGFINGLVKEVASLAALILGIWGAIKFSDFTAEKLYDYFDMTGQYVGLIAFLVTFGIIVVIIHFIGILADKIVTTVSLGFVNRLLGIAFGLLKSVLIMSVFFVILNAIDARKSFLPKETIEKSMFYNPISDIAPLIFPIIGEGGFNRSFDRFKKKPEQVTI